MASLRRLACSIALVTSFVAAQFPPAPKSVTSKSVPQSPGVEISYKQTCICEEHAKAWAGYVHMPVSYLEDIEGSSPYNVSMFFWYFEARESPQNAPTAIYLAGGPGESSLYGATSDAGPCYIHPNSKTTYDNPWSWNNRVNMLYVDQPVGTGYSYDRLIKSTMDLLFAGKPATATGIVPFEAYGGHVPAENTTFKYGMFPSQNYNHTSNTTEVAAVTLWHFAQAWFSAFPEWTTSDSSVSIWGNSYGGFWVPASAAYIQKQNVKIKAGAVKGTVIDLNAIGITNGCIDMLYQTEWYPHMAFNNTYDLKLIDKATYDKWLAVWSEPKKGCRAQMLKCRSAAAKLDPKEFANNPEVNLLCQEATKTCAPIIFGSQGTVRSGFDMAHKLPDGYPTQYSIGFFQQGWVQEELGARVNWTGNSNLLSNGIVDEAGDPFRREGMLDVEFLLDSGIKVALLYGDRDMRCPWLGAEKLSLAANWSGADDFNKAGYAYVHTNNSYQGGVVRQHGNLSFTRIFEAGHDTSWYQPETTTKIFNRVLFGTDVATGEITTSDSYSTHGPRSSYHIKDKLPPSPGVNCNLWSAVITCTVDQILALQKGDAVIDGTTVVKPAGGGGPFSSGGGF